LSFSVIGSSAELINAADKARQAAHSVLAEIEAIYEGNATGTRELEERMVCVEHLIDDLIALGRQLA
jgi:hypothetical protein